MTDARTGRLNLTGLVRFASRNSARRAVRKIMRMVSALTIPAILVVLTLIAAWQWRSAPLSLADQVLPDLRPSEWLNWGHVIVCALFLIANLVERRMGEAMTLAHVLTSWVAACAIGLAVVAGLIELTPPVTGLPPTRTAAAFILAMALGQGAGAIVFDRTRGVAWWNAPVYSALTTSLIACPLFYVLAFAGTSIDWPHQMVLDLGLKTFMSFALLIPYFLLRSIVRPLPGLG